MKFLKTTLILTMLFCCVVGCSTTQKITDKPSVEVTLPAIYGATISMPMNFSTIQIQQLYAAQLHALNKEGVSARILPSPDKLILNRLPTGPWCVVNDIVIERHNLKNKHLIHLNYLGAYEEWTPMNNLAQQYMVFSYK